jgi:hypothetical protein
MTVNTTTQTRIRQSIKKIVDMLVNADYKGLEAITGGVRLRSDHIESGIVDYGKTLTFPPENAYDDIDVVAVADKTPSEYSIRFRLFTTEEGQSDLELQATLVDDNANGPEMRVEIDNIVVA